MGFPGAVLIPVCLPALWKRGEKQHEPLLAREGDPPGAVGEFKGGASSREAGGIVPVALISELLPFSPQASRVVRLKLFSKEVFSREGDWGGGWMTKPGRCRSSLGLVLVWCGFLLTVCVLFGFFFFFFFF